MPHKSRKGNAFIKQFTNKIRKNKMNFSHFFLIDYVLKNFKKAIKIIKN